MVGPSRLSWAYDAKTLKTVQAALGEILQLPILQYALLVVQEDGQPKTFTSEGIRDVERTIFTPHIIEKFVTAFRMGSQGAWFLMYLRRS